MPLGTEEGLGPGDIVLDGDSAPPCKGVQNPPLRLMSIVVKRSPISGTAELLSYWPCVVVSTECNVCTKHKISFLLDTGVHLYTVRNLFSQPY